MKLFYDRFFTDFSLICAFFPANAAIFLFQRTVVKLSIMCFRRFFALCNVKSVDFFPVFFSKICAWALRRKTPGTGVRTHKKQPVKNADPCEPDPSRTALFYSILCSPLRTRLHSHFVHAAPAPPSAGCPAL